MKIAFAGSHGVGKTTLARWLAKELGYTLIPDISRELRILGLYPDRNGKKEEHYAYTLFKKMRLEDVNESFVTDGAVYSDLVYATVDGLDLDSVEPIIMSHAKYDRLFYITAEFDPEADAIRPADKSYQDEVDQFYRDLLESYSVKFIEVGGDLKSRKKKILNYIPKG